ncbi:hypothetical protein F5X96DRAFT_679155 [Biscogniauxia mediterranea]|nr:hypothetical protein F5X96DRAFT_679155 [Biscogniauxia mediterranea]
MHHLRRIVKKIKNKHLNRSIDKQAITSTLATRRSESNITIGILPTPASEFLLHLDQNRQTPTREVLEPYLSYEAWLRQEFMRPGSEIDDLANLTQIYNGQEDLFRIRTIDRRRASSEKYLLPLHDNQREVDDSLAIAPTLKEYQKNFSGFTHDWSNIVVAGSSALLPLLSPRRDVSIGYEPTVENRLETYYQNTANSSDIDIFIYGLDSEDKAIQRIIEIEELLRKNQRLDRRHGLSLRSENAITLISPKYPFRHVQIILRLYRSISEILTGFDVDCACVAFDGNKVYSNPRGITAIATRTNTIDLSRRSPSYENRLWKYRNHNFEVYWDSLDRSRIKLNFSTSTQEEDYPKIPRLTGLARLLYSEHYIKDFAYRKLKRSYKARYVLKRALKRIDNGGDQTPATSSGYATFDIPYSTRYRYSRKPLVMTTNDTNITRIREYVIRHAKEPCMFGTIREVTGQYAEPGKKGVGRRARNKRVKPSEKVTFIKDNPGRQMIGSFHPLDADDW